MTWTAERTSANQRVQIGPESTTALGTSVAAGKLLECFDFTFGIQADVNFYTPTGRKYANVQEENTEWTDIAITGNLDYNGVIYLLAGIMGSSSVAAHLASATAKDWVYTPPLSTPSVVPQTYTIQQGDAIRAHQAAYGLVTEFAYKGTRKDFSCSAKMIAQPITDGITLTASPTAVALSPVVAKQVNVYLDTTSAGLGATQLTRALSVDYTMTNTYGPLWVLNRTTTGWAAHVDLVPKATVKLKVEADANGMAMLGYLQTGTTYWLRVDALGTTAIAGDGPGNIFAEFKHDMAVKFGKPSTFSDDQGVYAIEWELTVVEDPTWAKAQTITVTNLLAAL
ncbi:MAG: hypothetical protein ABI324_26325 [Ktedonobacteraceae bacterium]